MRICVTGGSGFIGSYFVRSLTSAGHSITILDLIAPPRDYPAHRHVRGDIREPAAVRDALRGCDRLLHLAAAHHDFGIAHDTFYAVNEQGARVLCDGMDEAGVRDASFYSTVAVYGDAAPPHRENSPTSPNSPYGGSKLAGEGVFEQWTRTGGGRRCMVIRPTVTFGPRNFANMYSLIRQIYRNRFVQVGPGSNIKSLSYVENIVAFTHYLWDTAAANPGRPAFDVYNFIDKPDLTSREIAATIYEALGRRAPRVSFPLWLALAGALPFDAVIKLTGKNLPISGARIRKLFNAQTKFEADRVAESGFKPPVPLREGIARMVRWYVEEGRHQSAEWHLPPAVAPKYEPASQASSGEAPRAALPTPVRS